MKRVISFFVCMFMILSLMPVYASADDGIITVQAPDGNTAVINGVNRPIQAANELLLFTRENSSELTDSNPWCAAAIVDYADGKYVVTDVKDREGAVKIPYNGFVIFGHGTNEQWILDNLKIGDEVKVNGYQIPEPAAGSAIKLDDGTQHTVDGIDVDRESDKLFIYTYNYGSFTKPFGSDTGEAIVANNIVVDKNTDGSHGTYIPTNGYVISGTGTEKELIESLNIGDKITPVNITIPVLPQMYFKITNSQFSTGLIVPIDNKNTGRGSGQVIYYDSAFGSSTGTNPWGMEITVVDGKITHVASIEYKDGVFVDNNSAIPQGGYVLSVQSDSPFFSKLNGYVNVGDGIDISLNNLKIYNAGRTSYNAYNPKTREDNPAGWDDSNNAPYPGFRGADQLIIYDSSYGSTTGTNQWGYEVTVNSSNKIIKTGGNNSSIPQGGYVLSGHGVMADWLKANAFLGADVKIDKDNRQVLIILTPMSYVSKANILIGNAKESLAASKGQFLDVPYKTIEQYIDDATAKIKNVQDCIEARDYEGMAGAVADIENLTDKAGYANYESKKVDNRSVWIRPKETSESQVAANLDKLKAMNINTIYLETWWGGYTIFPTDNGITEQNPMYKGFDVLKAYLDEGHKRGMEIHCWVENFFIGDSATNNGGPVVAKKPEWLLLSRKGDNYQYVDMYNVNYYFANPALPEARDFVMSIYTELVKKYNIDGLQLDYVRYPDAGDGTNDYGYDTYTRDLFKKAEGVDPINVFPGDPLWNTWCQFRANIINTFVYRVVSEVKALKPSVKISADVWPDYADGPTTLMQEPKDWVSKGYIGSIIPMSYSEDIQSAANDTINTLSFANGHAYVTVGLSTCSGYDVGTTVGQTGAAYKSGADGTGMFEFESLMSGGYGDELQEGVYRNPAITTDGDIAKSISTILKDIPRKMEEIYVPFGGMSTVQYQNYNKLFSKLTDTVNDVSSPTLNGTKAEIIKQMIGRYSSDVKDDSKLDNEVKQRMLTDLNSCSKILTNYIAGADFISEHKVSYYTVEAQLDGAKIGDTIKTRVKAVFKDSDDDIMYLDPSQYTITSSDPGVVQVNGGSLSIKGTGGVNLIVKISKDFIFSGDSNERTFVQKLQVK